MIAQVETRNFAQPELRLYRNADSGNQVIRCLCRCDEAIDLGAQSRPGNHLTGSGGAEIGGIDANLGPVTGTDSGPLEYALRAGAERTWEILVGHRAGRQSMCHAHDPGATCRVLNALRH